MLRAALGFFILALIAMVLGAGNIAGISMEIGRMLLVVFLILAVISLVAHLVTGRSPNKLLSILLVTAGASYAMAEETAAEKVEIKGREGIDYVKEASRDMSDKVCETINGKLKCVTKKVAHKAKTATHKVKTKAKEVENKVD